MIIHNIRKIYNDSLIKNSIYLMMSNVFSLIVGFFFWIIAARYYTAHDIGSASVILSGMALISMICVLGFPIALIYFLPRDPKNANKMINSCMIVSVVVATLLSLIWITRADMWAPELKSSIGIGYMMIFIVMVVAETSSTIMIGAFIAGRKSSYYLIKEIIFSIVKILPIILLSGFGAMGILLSWTAGLILSTIIGFILLYKLWGYLPKLTVDPIIKTMLSLSVGNYVAGIIGYIPRSLLPILIANLVSTDAAGYFFIAMTIASVVNTVPQFIASSLLAESHKEEELWNNVIKAVRFNICLIFPGLLLFMIFGKFVLNLFNPVYATYALTTLFILVTVSIPLIFNNIFNAVRNSQKRVKSVIINNMVVAGITIILSIYLLKVRGIEGAAMAYLIANTVVAMTVIYRVKNPIGLTLKLYREFITDINMVFRKLLDIKEKKDYD